MGWLSFQGSFLGAARGAAFVRARGPELRSILDMANDEWRSMILFGLYTGQRFGDIATLPRLNNLDLVRGELRLSTQKQARQ
jgi:hypothetical protein